MRRGNDREKFKERLRTLWLDENLMWVRLLAGPRALESSVKVSSKSGAPTRGVVGEYSEAIEPVVVFPAYFTSVIVKYLVESLSIYVSHTLDASMYTLSVQIY